MNKKNFVRILLMSFLVSFIACEEELEEEEAQLEEVISEYANEEINARFSASIRILDDQAQVTFTNRSENAADFLWSFPGGNPEGSTQENPVILYPSNGDFTVTLEAITNDLSDSVTQNLTINGAEQEVQMQEIEEEIIDNQQEIEANVELVARFAASVRIVNNQAQVTLANRSENAVSFEWTLPGATPESTTEENPVVIYPNNGTFEIKLVASNENVTDTTIQNITINNIRNDDQMLQEDEEQNIVNEMEVQGEANARFFVSVRRVNGDFQVAMRNRSENATSFEWSFPGGNPESSTEENPTVLYSEAGTRTITLTASNGNSSSTTSAELTL